MKAITLLLVVVMASISALAGDSGVTLMSCMSESKRTTVVVRTDDYAEDVRVEAFLAIDGSMIVERKSMVCAQQSDFACPYVNIDYKGLTVTAGAEDSTTFRLEFSNADLTKAVLKKGFVDPRTYRPFNSDVQLNCTYSYENP